MNQDDSIDNKASEEQQPSIWEMLDELIGLDRASLKKALGVVISVLVIITSFFIYREVKNGRTAIALLYSGFLLLLFGLTASIAWVLGEVSRLEAVAGENGGSERAKSD